MTSRPSTAATPDQLLQTKLYAPRVTRGLVDRPRLSDQLGWRGRRYSSSPLRPASGSPRCWPSALLNDAGGRRPAVAWLSLDPGDNDPSTYWAYVLAAIRTAAPEVGGSAQVLLESPGGAPITTVLTSLLNDLAVLRRGDRARPRRLPRQSMLPTIHEAMAFLVDHLPPQLRLVIATRSDPPLPLARLRARGELAEVRAADLRFTEQETAAYFDGMGLRLSAGEVTTLEGRTEGWVAALQLAALSLQGREDAAGFIDGFAGDDRHVVDYLVEEVVHRQPEEVRDFLLRTSVLTRLSGPLTDAVTGRTDGRAMLEALDRDNLFLVPLDDQRRWYRYHHLFADMLQARLLDERPGEAPELHRRASAWHEQDGDTTAAIEHALAAGDADRAAGLVEAVISGHDQGAPRGPAAPLDGGTSRGGLRRSSRAGQRLRRRPDVHRRDPRGRAPAAHRRAVGGRGPGGPRRRPSRRVSWSPTRPSGEGSPAGSGSTAPGCALMAGDVAATMDHGREAIAVLDPGDDLGHGAATALMGLASWRQGDLATAEAAYAETIRRFELVGYVADILGCAITLADLQMTQGRLRDAERTYRDALDLAGRQPGWPAARHARHARRAEPDPRRAG